MHHLRHLLVRVVPLCQNRGAFFGAPQKALSVACGCDVSQTEVPLVWRHPKSF